MGFRRLYPEPIRALLIPNQEEGAYAMGAIQAITPVANRLYIRRVNPPLLAPAKVIGASWINGNANAGDTVRLGLYLDGLVNLAKWVDTGSFNVGAVGANQDTYNVLATPVSIPQGQWWLAIMISSITSIMNGYSESAGTSRPRYGYYYDPPGGYAAGLPSAIPVASLNPITATGTTARFPLNGGFYCEL